MVNSVRISTSLQVDTHVHEQDVQEIHEDTKNSYLRMLKMPSLQREPPAPQPGCLFALVERNLKPSFLKSVFTLVNPELGFRALPLHRIGNPN